ncbi:MAG: transposase, partial [Acidobacteriota bacterium]
MEGALWLLRQLVGRLRRLSPRARLRVRLDGGFSGPELMDGLEGERLEHVVGLAKNSVLQRKTARLRDRAWRAFDRAGRAVTLNSELRYAAGTWRAQTRRIIVKAEIVRHEGRLPRENVRFVVTNLRHRPDRAYQLYCQRGEIENRIKELFDGIEIGRTSRSRFMANQCRVLLTLGAYALMQELRRQMSRFDHGRPQVHRLRLMLIKIGGRVAESVRRVVIQLAQSHPWQRPWLRLARSLQRAG